MIPSEKLPELQQTFVQAKRAAKEFRGKEDGPFRKGVKRLEYLFRAALSGGLGKLLRVKHLKGPIDPADLKSILIIPYGAIGDMVVATPLWRTIKLAAPHIRIGVVSSFRSQDVLRCDPDVDVVIDMTENTKKQMFRGIRNIRREKWDLVLPVAYHNRTRAAIIARLCSPKGITTTAIHQNRVKHYSQFYDYVTAERPTDTRLLIVERLHDHLYGVLKLPKEVVEFHPSIAADPLALAAVNERVDAMLAESGASRVVIVNTESANAFREFGPENDYELSTLITEHYPDVLVLWTSSPAMADRARSVLAAKPNPRMKYFATGNIHELVAVIRRASLVVTPDTSVAHIASAEKKPIVGLYVLMNEWYPYGVPQRILLPKIHQAVSTIKVADAFAGVQELLHAAPYPSPEGTAEE